MSDLRHHKLHLTALTLATLFSTAFSIAGGVRTNAAGLGMAQAVVASSRGLESIGINPSNLALPLAGTTREYVHCTVTHDTTFQYRNRFNIDTVAIVSVSHDSLVVVHRSPPTLTLSLLPVAAHLESNVLTPQIYSEYFTRSGGGSPHGQQYLTHAEKAAILGLLADDFIRFDLNAGARLFGISYNNDAIGTLALTLTDRASVNADLPKDYIRFAFFGLDSLGSSYDFRGTNLRGWYLREYAISYARLFSDVLSSRDFSVGVSLKLVQGFAGVFTDRFDVRFSNTAERDSATGAIQNYSLQGQADVRILRSISETFAATNFTAFPKPAGRGFGVDFGLSAEIIPAVRLAASVVDLGSIRWFSNTKMTVASGTLELTNPVSGEQAERAAHAISGVDTAGEEFTTPLATSVCVGAAIQIDRASFMSWIPGRWIVTLDYRRDLNQLPGNSPHAQYAIGSEYRPLVWMPLRTGFSYTQSDQVRWSAGAGLDFGAFGIDFGTENVKFLFSQGDYDLISASMAMTVRL